MTARILIGVELICFAVIGTMSVVALSASDPEYLMLMMLVVGGWLAPALLVVCMIAALFVISLSGRGLGEKRSLLMTAVAPAVISIGLLAWVFSSEIMFFFEPMRHG